MSVTPTILLGKAIVAATFACCVLTGPAIAQAVAAAKWPTRPVKLIVPFAPGAGADIGARLAANALSSKWKQSVIVENRPGGDSLIAIKAVIAANDDHQLLFAASGNFTPHPYRHKSLGYNRERDLLPVARFSNTIVTVAVASSLNVSTLPELITLAKARPSELNVVMVPGITEMVWDSFVKTEIVKITKVPFTNVTQGASEMLSGARPYGNGRPGDHSADPAIGQDQAYRRHQSGAGSASARRSDGFRSRGSIIVAGRAGRCLCIAGDERGIAGSRWQGRCRCRSHAGYRRTPRRDRTGAQSRRVRRIRRGHCRPRNAGRPDGKISGASEA